MKQLYFIPVLLVSFVGMGQNPFNYGKSKAVYFFSAAEMKRLAIKEIYTVAFTKNPGEEEKKNLFIIDFISASSEPRSVRDGWSPYNGTKRKPSLQQLIDSSTFYNGIFYDFDEKGKINLCGGEGHGTMCRTGYEHGIEFTLATEDCRYGETSNNSKIYYYPNGLVKFSVCCQIDSFTVEKEEEDSVNTESTDAPNDYKDTTWYIYNSKWQITGTKTKSGFSPIFNLKHVQAFGNTQSYVNRTIFELFIDKRVGYRPKLILFEIYRNAVFTFKYNEKIRKYEQFEDIHLER